MVFSLATERLVLDDLTLEDLPHIRRIGNDRELMRYVLIWLDTDEQIRLFLQHAIDEAEKIQGRRDYTLAARDRRTREFIGLTFIEIDPAQESTAEVGIVLLPAFCRNGYGSEILRTYLRFGFGTLGMHRVFGKCDEQNLPSARLMERCGLVYEGTIREHVWLRDHWRSTRYYGMVAGEYAAGRA
ncbi:GNAT family protein [Methanoregula sp.]|uniref:GNAT family N-acetyltransferase n=1 Tax=Methanoregula sp. TaxID=2052170 RepID=UPI002622A2F0|nr:GNAT family protein [Methanoregula sp.]MDD5143319.1 GNAT family protein [Methanoregula sp.]